MEYKILNGNCLDKLKELDDNSIDCCVTSPPYYALRDYGTGHWEGGDPNCPHKRLSKISKDTKTGHAGMYEHGEVVGDAIYKDVCPLCGAVRVDEQIGLEETPDQYIQKLVEVFHEVKRVLKDSGTLWINIGDSYASNSHSNHNFDYSHGSKANNDNICKTKTLNGDIKQKDLIGIPWMLAFALRKDGWYLRQDIIWHKPNPMPESVTDRFTKSHEYIFLLTKSPKYYFNHDNAMEVATGYDGRKDTVLKSSPKYDGVNITPGGPQTLASGRHERWKFAVTVNENSKYNNDEYNPLGGHNTFKESGKTWNQSYDGLVPIRNKRDVWECDYSASKYSDEEEESSVRQGMHKNRGNNIVYSRKNLPDKEQFLDFIRDSVDVNTLSKCGISKTTIEHWFRKDIGFSFPSVEDWLICRDILDDGSDTFKDIDSKLTDVSIESDSIDKNFDGYRNKRDVWSITVNAYKGAHFATYPEKLVEPCILCGCPDGGTVLDPFNGSGTTGAVALKNGMKYIGIELNQDYIDLTIDRFNKIEGKDKIVVTSDTGDDVEVTVMKESLF